MADPTNMWENAARAIVKAQRELAPKMAAMMPPGPNTVKYSPEDERKAFWQRDPAMTPEAEQGLWLGMISQFMHTDPMMPYTTAMQMAAPTVAQAVYPARLQLIRSGARKLSVEQQIAYAKKMERLGPPTEQDNENG